MVSFDDCCKDKTCKHHWTNLTVRELYRIHTENNCTCNGACIKVDSNNNKEEE